MNLQGKSILFISVSFFNYEKYIKAKLEEFGAKVDFYDERPSNSLLSKGLIRVKKSFLQRKINNYYSGIWSEIKEKSYDFFLLIKGESIPEFFIKELVLHNKNIISIYYTYDSFKNNLNAKKILKFFTRKFTFDRLDAIKYGLQFRPLFYVDEYKNLGTIQEQTIYDIAFLGTMHSDRYVISEKVREWCLRKGLQYFAYYYSPGKLVLLFRKLFDRTSENFDFNKVSSTPLSVQNILNIYSKANTVLDIHHPNQIGLTMRTFEVLAAGRKLLTTNADIKNYWFYNPENIQIVDRKNIELDKDFFLIKFKPIDTRLFKLMSLDGWVECLFKQNISIDTWLKTKK